MTSSPLIMLSLPLTSRPGRCHFWVNTMTNLTFSPSSVLSGVRSFLHSDLQKSLVCVHSLTILFPEIENMQALIRPLEAAVPSVSSRRDCI